MTSRGSGTRGRVPDWTEYLTVGVDVHKRHIEWIATAWKGDGTGHVVDYGVFEVEADERKISIEQAILSALREFRDLCLTGWAQSTGGPRIPDQVWFDHGYQGSVVDAFCNESRQPGPARFRPAMGRGVMQQRTNPYTAPRKRSATIGIIGEGYHLSRRHGKLELVEVNADDWKTWVHQRLSCPADAPGALTFFHAPPRDHYVLVRQLTAEKQVQELIPGRGDVIRWERIRRNNHYLDCAYNAAAAAHLCGVRLIAEKKPVVVTDFFARQRRQRLTTPDGRPFLITERRD